MTQRVHVALVTGGNKGIGLEIVRSLCRHLGQNGVVYLTARNEERGRAAVELLQKEGLCPTFHILDVTKQSDIDRLREHLEKTHGGLDILCNNAGIGTPTDLPLHQQVVKVLQANFFGVLNVSRAFIPLVRSGGRVVNVASTTSYMVFRELGEEVKTKFRIAAHEEDVVNLMNEFIEVCKAGTNAEKGWPEWGYGVSKLGVVALSKAQAGKIDEDKTRHDILLNVCCPGFVLTDMTANLPDDFYGGVRVSTVEGADTPVYLALLPPDAKQPHGNFLLRRQVYDFINTDVSIQL